MRLFFSSFLVLFLLLAPTLVHADDVLYDGVEDKELRAEDFSVTKDGYVVGHIINDSDRVRRAVKIDIWATDKNDTRIFWRKSINFGDLAPKTKYSVREPYSKDVDPTLPAKFSFKLTNPSKSSSPPGASSSPVSSSATESSSSAKVPSPTTKSSSSTKPSSSPKASTPTKSSSSAKASNSAKGLSPAKSSGSTNPPSSVKSSSPAKLSSSPKASNPAKASSPAKTSSPESGKK